MQYKVSDMNYNLEIQRFLLKVDKLDNVEDIVKTLKSAINVADANNDISWGYDLRQMLIRHEGSLIKRTESIPAFTWILNAYDNNPELFYELDILYDYAWMISIAYCETSISKLQIDQIMDDYQRRLTENGYSLRSYYELQVDWYLFTGDAQSARKAIELRNNEAEDALSPQTERITDICVELLDTNTDKGIALAQELMARSKNDENNIFNTYNQLIYYLNKAGDKRAFDFFEKSDVIFQQTDKKPFLLFELSLMMYHMSKHEKEKAWQYFELYAEWATDANDYSRFDFSLAVLPLFSEGGEKRLNLSSKLPFYKQDGIYRVADIYDFYYAQATNLANLFDVRDGNTYFADQIEWHLNCKT